MIAHSIAAGINTSIARLRVEGRRVPVEKWHGVPTEGKPDLVSIEIEDVIWRAPMPYTRDTLVAQCQPNLPWADDHFEERISGVPLNPGEQYKNWPWYQPDSQWDEQFRDAAGVFTHTYMERFWPKHAGMNLPPGYPEGRQFPDAPIAHNKGIRYPYGDLADVIALLIREPLTRQAWLPVWFPEDTGAVHEGRVPCTLGYHFMLRDGKFHCKYVIRSCDAVRYLRDDIYMAVKLAWWVMNEIKASDLTPDWDDVVLGNFTFVCFSLHMFEGDKYA